MFIVVLLGVILVQRGFLDNRVSSIEVRFRCPDEHLNNMIMQKLDFEIKAFTEKVNRNFNTIAIDMDMRKRYIKVRGIPEYECKINLTTDKGSFYASEVGIGAIRALNESFRSLETQIFKKIGKMNKRIAVRDKDPYTVLEFEEN